MQIHLFDPCVYRRTANLKNGTDAPNEGMILFRGGRFV